MLPFRQVLPKQGQGTEHLVRLREGGVPCLELGEDGLVQRLFFLNRLDRVAIVVEHFLVVYRLVSLTRFLLNEDRPRHGGEHGDV
jgi:hypothetical protein